MGRKHRQKPIVYPKGVLIEVDTLKVDDSDRYIEGFITSTIRLKNEKFERWLKGKHVLQKGMVQCPRCQKFNNALRKVCEYCNALLPELPKNQEIKQEKPAPVETREEKVIRYRQETRFLNKKLKKKLRKEFEKVC